MLARPHIVSADHWVCEATDTSGNYQSETACHFYKDARGGDERIKPRLAEKYRWWEFPVVITGNYRPGKYSKFCQSGKYWEI